MRTLSITKNLSVLTVLILTVSRAFSATTVESEFELFLSKKFQSAVIDQQWKSLEKDEFHLNWPISDQSILAGGVEVKLEGLKAQISTQMEKPVSEIHSQVQIRSKALGASLTISKISVDQVVERTYGGITGKFRIQAECKNVQIDLKPGYGVFSLLVAPDIQSTSGKAVIQDFSAQWDPEAFVATSLHCTGAEGFGDLLQVELKKLISQPDLISPYKNKILAEMNSSLGQYVLHFAEKKELVVGRPDIRVWMEVKEYKEISSAGVEGALVKGHFSVEFSRLNEASPALLKLEPATVSASQEAVLRLPKSFINVMAEKTFAANTWVETIKSSQVSGFSSLMSSRFMQFFVWPELMRFPKTSVFTFDVYSDTGFKVTGGENLLYSLSGQLLAQMNAPKAKGYVNFMSFAVPLSSQVKLSVSEGLLKAQILEPAMKLRSFWNQDYVKQYNPSSRVSSSTIRNQILNSLADKKMEMKLPVIPLTEGLNLKVKSLEAAAQGQSVRVILSVSP